MPRTAFDLRRDALAIWQAGVEAVRGDRLVRHCVRVEGPRLRLGEETIDLAAVRRIAVVGAGKAGAAMAAGLEQALGPRLMEEKRLEGWVNVPADCVRPLARITLHAARPAGVNEPTAAGIVGAERILRLVDSLDTADLCLCLLSGGGSALLPAPVEGVSLADKQAVTRHLSAAGADIRALNSVRKPLSRIKGGGLARACRAGRLVSLIISDVLGDPLDTIASGPTVEEHASPRAALEVLERFGAQEAGIAPAAIAYLESAAGRPPPVRARCRVTNLVIGNNAVAVDAAGAEAERRGYSHALASARGPEPAAEEVGRHLAGMALRMRDEPGPDCLITGGEPVVRLADPAVRGKGGRNQQLVLAALDRLLQEDPRPAKLEGMALLSGGTDGEDGPTDAAGAYIDAPLVEAALERRLDPADFLRRNDAYHFFAPISGLIKSGPTGTNVSDLRVVVVDQKGDKSNYAEPK
jgi:glycerate 2-kinase